MNKLFLSLMFVLLASSHATATPAKKIDQSIPEQLKFFKDKAKERYELLKGLEKQSAEIKDPKSHAAHAKKIDMARGALANLNALIEGLEAQLEQ